MIILTLCVEVSFSDSCVMWLIGTVAMVTCQEVVAVAMESKEGRG